MRHRLQNLIIALVVLGLASAAAGQDVEVRFGWAACRAIDDDGAPCAPATRYDVYLQEGGAAEELVASVDGDTTYTVTVTRGVVQRIRVVGYDASGRASVPSEWSDPIYIEVERGAEHGAEAPPVLPALRANYPNPFNPETAIVYGVPEGTPPGTRAMLAIYTPSGRRVRTFAVDATPGWHEVRWNGTDDQGRLQPTGTYLTRYVCGDIVEVGKMTMVK